MPFILSATVFTLRHRARTVERPQTDHERTRPKDHNLRPVQMIDISLRNRGFRDRRDLAGTATLPYTANKHAIPHENGSRLTKTVSVDLKTFGAALKALREARGISQKELIGRVPFHYSTER